MKLFIPLVGMHFRPPAQQVLASLALGTEVLLYPEPDNQYDSNAVRVVVDLPNIDVKTPILDAMLTGTGFRVSDIIMGPLQLGYLAATGGKPAQGGPGNVEALLIMSGGKYQARLSALPDGRPSVEIQDGHELPA